MSFKVLKTNKKEMEENNPEKIRKEILTFIRTAQDKNEIRRLQELNRQAENTLKSMRSLIDSLDPKCEMGAGMLRSIQAGLKKMYGNSLKDDGGKHGRALQNLIYIDVEEEADSLLDTLSQMTEHQKLAEISLEVCYLIGRIDEIFAKVGKT